MTETTPARPGLRWALIQHAVLGMLTYVPLLATAPGWVAADTKAYLYLDPGRLLARASSLWDPNVALGTVTHQNIGYLWPMGPWYWAFDALGVPDWIAQRLWMATLLFVAGAGLLHLARTLGWGRAAPQAALAASLVYALSPYVLDYVARISVLLLPWAALPWLLALVHRALATGSWRHPAAFALVVATVGGVNATALVLVGVAPLLWVACSVWLHREVTVGAALATVGRIAVLAIPVNVWWMAGLAVQSGWGLDVLRYTETVETVARSGLASETLRGLGYWFFYGTDKLGPWIEPGRTFTESPLLIAVGFVVPVLATCAAVALHWRYRAFAVALVLLGTAMAVGAYPYRDPSPLGRVFKSFATSSTAGLALRSTARAVPLVVLGMALLVGAGLAALARRRPQLAGRSALAVGLVAVLANPPLWTGQFVGDNLRRPEDLPDYWEEAATELDNADPGTRVLEVPGSDFATYRWGNTVDPITPGLIDRPYVARELVPFGTEASADLLIAFDRRIQEGVLDPAAVVPFARLVGAGDIVLRGDLEFERYRTARPTSVSSLLQAVPGGLGRRRDLGKPTVNEASPELPMHDEVWFQGRRAGAQAPVSIHAVNDPLPIVRSRSATGAVVLAGDGEGVVEAGAAGLLDGDGVLLTSAALADRPQVLARALRHGASLVVTDSNRRRGMRWGTVRDNDGYTEPAGEVPLRDDPSDNRLPLYPAAGDDAFTTVEQRGVKRVQATAYGNPVTFTPADRPANAFDGDPSTAWTVGALGPVGGHRLLVEADEPVTTSFVEVAQARFGERVVTRVGLRLDGRKIASFELDNRSFEAGGQRLDLGRSRRFRTLELEIEHDSEGRKAHYDDQNGVGFREIRVADLRVDELVRLPDDLLRQATADRPLTLLLARQRANPAEPFARDEEPTLARVLTLPAARTFRVGGQSRVEGALPDDRLDRLLGPAGGVPARSSGRIQGDLRARASAALDGDPSTAWRNSFGRQAGAWLEVGLGASRSVDRLDLVVVADGSHSVPSRVVVSTDAGDRRVVDVPPVQDGQAVGHTVAVPLRFAAVSGSSLRLTVEAVRPVTTIDWFSKRNLTMPVAVAELGVPDLRQTAGRGEPWACRDDLLTIGGRPVWLEVLSDGDAAASLQGLDVRSCGPDAAGINLAAGQHVLRAAPGIETGFDLDRLVLASAAGGGATPAPTGRPTGPTASGSTRVLHESRTSMQVEVRGDESVWLVLGQSHSDGWRATVDGRSLGQPVLVDGFANGWLVDPGGDGVVTVELRWTPQRVVRAGLAVSAVGALACLAVLVVGTRRRRRVAPAGIPLPSIREPLWSTGSAASWATTGATAVVAGVVGGALVHPLVGIGVATVAVAGLRLPHGRMVGATAVAFVAAAGAFTAGTQWRNDYDADFGWVDFFRPAHVLAWTGLLLLAVALLVDWHRRRP